MPLHIRRERLALRFLLKAEYGKYAPGKEPLFTVLKRYLAGQDRTPIARLLLDTPPWHLKPPHLDASLADRIKKESTPPAVMKAEALCLIDT